MALPSRIPSEPATHRLLFAELERAFQGDPGARIFVTAALRESRRPALPTDATALLDFVRAHLLSVVTGELGPSRAAAFLAHVTRALDAVARPVPHASHVRVRGPVVAKTVTTSVRGGKSRPRIALVHEDRLTRIGVARRLLQVGYDVVVVDSFTDLASIAPPFPQIAVVHRAARNVGVLLEGMVTLRPDVAVALLGEDASGAEALLLRCGVRRFAVLDSEVELAGAVECLHAEGGEPVDTLPRSRR